MRNVCTQQAGNTINADFAISITKQVDPITNLNNEDFLSGQILCIIDAGILDSTMMDTCIAV